ncbi:hypothetical protein BGX27_002212 [Mortierella sp. AM989]|nr:hypothetical protein BGX27_002212 [Mortierella sp. AM989]
MIRKEREALEKHLSASSPAGSRAGHQTHLKEKPNFIAKSVSDFIDNRPKQGRRPRNPDDADEKEQHGGARDQLKNDPNSPFLTTTNTWPPKSKHKHKGHYENDSTPGLKKRHDTPKADHVHRKSTSKPTLTTAYQLPQRKKEDDRHEKSNDIRNLEQPYRHIQKHKHNSSRSLSQPSPENRKQYTSPLKHHQLKSPTSISPSRRPIKGTIIDVPSSYITPIDSPPPLSPPSTSKLNSDGSIVSPNSRRKLLTTRRIESVGSLPDLPETEEDYDALPYSAKVRLGDPIKVRNMIIERQNFIGFPSPAADSTQRDNKGKSKEKANGEAERKRSLKLQRDILRSDSGSDLEDADLFTHQPLGSTASKASLSNSVSSIESSAAASTPPSISTYSRKMAPNSTMILLKKKMHGTDSTSPISLSKERIAKGPSRAIVDEIENFSSDDEDPERNDFQNRAGRDRPVGVEKRIGASNTSTKGASRITTIKEPRTSKQIVVTDEARQKFQHLLPKASQYIGKENPSVDSSEATSAAHPEPVSKKGREIMPVKDKPPKDFFNLSKDQPRPSVPSKRSEVVKTTGHERRKPLIGGGGKRTDISNRGIKRSPSLSSDSEIELGLIGFTEWTRSRARTPTDQTSDRSTDRNGTGAWTSKSGKNFQLPSPKRIRVEEFLPDNDLPNSGLLDIVDAENTCPYCGDVLPKDKSKRLASALAKVQARLKGKQQPQQPQPEITIIDSDDEFSIITKDTEDRSPRNSSLSPVKEVIITGVKSQPRPRRLDRQKRNLDINTKSSVNENKFAFEEFVKSPTSSSRISLMEKFEFCRIHFAEERIVPSGIQENYPLHIDFSELEGRVLKFEHELREIIYKTKSSMFLDQALSRYKSMGTLGARHPHTILANVEQTLPGYYGSKGSAELSKILVKLFLESEILTHDLAHPQKPIEYIQQVLVPEAGLRLIIEDRTKLKHQSRTSHDGGGGVAGQDQQDSTDVVSLEDALKVMRNSVEFGNYIHDIL